MAPRTDRSAAARASEEYYRKKRHRRRRQDHSPSRNPRSSHNAPTTSESTTTTLSASALAKLDAINEKQEWVEYEPVRQPRRVARKQEVDYEAERRDRERRATRREQRRRKETEDHNHYREPRKSRRVVSGPLLEDGEYEVQYHRSRRKEEPPLPGGYSDYEDEEARKRKRRKWIWIISSILLVIIIVSIGVGVALKKNTTSSSGAKTTSATNTYIASPGSIPPEAQGTILDFSTWYDTTDFNLTFTNATVGGLSTIGLNSTWDDSKQANNNVPALKDKWEYGIRVIRGINLGGWLSIEPFITPSLFNQYSTSQGVVDEWTLCQTLGPAKAKAIIEKHYATFVNEQTFADIQAAGFDHIRLPYPYWAVTTYDSDPYVPQIAWRYLLRGLEYARKYGLRINLDLHALPGSQNGWNHSGHLGQIGWLNGTDGALNAQRSLDIHKQLTTFFAQPRYANLVTMYGLANEPRMVDLHLPPVIAWTTSAIAIVRSSGMSNDTIIVIGDGFLGLRNWQGVLSGHENVLLDAHQYVVFNNDQLSLAHTPKIEFACQGWAQQTNQSMNPSTGFGNFLCGEWSQSDTDCQPWLNNVGTGARWDGTLNPSSPSTPICPNPATKSSATRCDCTLANADPSKYSTAYKQWLKMFAEAQMQSYELGWGWFYWTWQTETGTQWSWKKGVAAGILPTNVQAQRSFVCGEMLVPDFGAMGLGEAY